MYAELSRHTALRLPAAIRRDIELPKYQPLNRDAERAVAESIWFAREAAWSVILSERLARDHAASLLGLEGMADMLSAATVARHDQDDAALRACVAHLSPGAAKAARQAIARVDAAVRRLERHNVKLVLYVIARWFRGLTDPTKSPFEVGDLLGWGSLGCRTAAMRFDPATGNKFSTFATWWIRAAIHREVQDARYRVRLPVHLQERIALVLDAEKALQAAHGIYNADDRTVAKAAGLSLATTRAAREAMRLHAAPSLDSPLRTADVEGTPGAFIDAIEDRDAASEADLTEQMDLSRRQAMLGAALSTLSERERFIVEARHGLGVWQGDEATLSDIGEVFGISRERVRVVEAAAMFKVGREVRRAMARKADAGDAVSC